MAEVVPHLSLPVRGPLGRHAPQESKAPPGGPAPALPGRIWGVPEPGPGDQKLESRTPNEWLSRARELKIEALTPAPAGMNSATYEDSAHLAI